jgi:hypothetical protein
MSQQQTEVEACASREEEMSTRNGGAGSDAGRDEKRRDG